MAKTYHMSHITDLGELLPARSPKYLEIFVPVGEVAFLIYLIKLLET